MYLKKQIFLFIIFIFISQNILAEQKEISILKKPIHIGDDMYEGLGKVFSKKVIKPKAVKLKKNLNTKAFDS